MAQFRNRLRARGGSRGQSGGNGNAAVKVLAHRLYGPGHNSGTAPPTGDGTTKTYTISPTLRLGTSMRRCSIVCQGWTLRTTGVENAGNNFPVSGTIEYPVGTIIANIPTFDVVNGSYGESAEIDLGVDIPDNAVVKVNLSSAVPNGQKYIVNLGFAGLRAHLASAALTKKARFGAFGDSIMTNNNGSVNNAAGTRTGCYQNSISGTRASTYGANNAEHFQKQCDLAAALGITHVVSNFGTNDFGAPATVAELQGWLTAMRDAVRARGMKFVQCTMLPRTTRKAARTYTTISYSGNTVSVTVDDPSLFTPGRAYNLSSVTPAEFAGIKMCIGKTGNVIDFLFAGSVAAAPTTITLSPWKDTSDPAWMDPFSSKFNSGAASDRGVFNAWVRSGVFDDYIEWADAVEPSRDSNLWLIGGQHSLLPDVQTIAVSSVTSTTRFNSNYSRGSSTISNGFIQPITGANVGVNRTGNSNTNGDITVSSAFPNAQAVNDNYYAVPGVSYMSDDGTHPRVAGGNRGGQAVLDAATAAWMDAKLAA